MFPKVKPFLNHWVLLIDAMHILLNRDIMNNQLVSVHEKLIRFVYQTQILYGKAAMTFNVHQLLHLVQSVIDWGSLQAHSCYSYESGNGQILRKIHAAKGVVHQIIRSIQFAQSKVVLQNHVLETNPLSPAIRM